MENFFRTIKSDTTAEIKEKKSRFIGYARHVETREEALGFVEEIKKKHYDARHNCWAYVVGNAGEDVRSSDDGEPSGTAGKPIMEVINGRGLTNICVVVTRYFGGVLLGTGGLVRAYTQATDAALETAEYMEMRPVVMLEVSTTYDDCGKLLRYFESAGMTVKNAEYGTGVVYEIIAPAGTEEAALVKIRDLTNAKAEAKVTGNGISVI